MVGRQGPARGNRFSTTGNRTVPSLDQDLAKSLRPLGRVVSQELRAQSYRNLLPEKSLVDSEVR